MLIPAGPDNDSGICCDVCGSRLFEQFVYYSYEFFKIRVFDNAQSQPNTNTPHSSIDVCDDCNDGFVDKIIANNKNRQRGVVISELSGDVIQPGVAYSTLVTQVKVDLRGKSPIVVTDKDYLTFLVSTPDRLSMTKTKG